MLQIKRSVWNLILLNLPRLPRVLIVEDDAETSALVASELDATQRYSAVAVPTLAAARQALDTASFVTDFDAIVLDVTLPDGDGRTLCAELRGQGVSLPIIILSGRDDEEDVVQALNGGADAYMRKPFHAAELLARLTVMLRDRTLS